MNQSFNSFADVVPIIETVDLRGTKVKLRGIGLPAIGDAIASFPAILDLFNGKIDAAALCAAIPAAAWALVGPALRKADDAAWKTSFLDDLNLTDQVDLVKGVLKATMPRGRDPFVELGKTIGLTIEIPNAANLMTSASPSPAPSSC